MNDKYPDYAALDDGVVYNFHLTDDNEPTASVWVVDGEMAFYDWVYGFCGSSLLDATKPMTFKEFKEFTEGETIVLVPTISEHYRDSEYAISINEIRTAALAWLLSWAMETAQDQSERGALNIVRYLLRQAGKQA